MISAKKLAVKILMKTSYLTSLTWLINYVRFHIFTYIIKTRYNSKKYIIRDGDVMKLKYFISGFIVSTVVFLIYISILASNMTQIEVSLRPLRYFVDGVEKVLDDEDKGFIYNDRTYVPVRKVAEMFGKKVLWDDKTSTIYFRSNDWLYGLREKQSRNLQRKDFDFLEKGMFYDEIYSKVGPPAEDAGSGIFIPVYNLEDGSRIYLSFPNNKTLYKVYIQYNDGTTEDII